MQSFGERNFEIFIKVVSYSVKHSWSEGPGFALVKILSTGMSHGGVRTTLRPGSPRLKAWWGGVWGGAHPHAHTNVK